MKVYINNMYVIFLHSMGDFLDHLHPIVTIVYLVISWRYNDQRTNEYLTDIQNIKIDRLYKRSSYKNIAKTKER